MAQTKPSRVEDARTRILLVDDHAVVRYGIAQLINRQADMVVCGEEENASNDGASPTIGRAERQARPR